MPPVVIPNFLATSKPIVSIPVCPPEITCLTLTLTNSFLAGFIFLSSIILELFSTASRRLSISTGVFAKSWLVAEDTIDLIL